MTARLTSKWILFTLLAVAWPAAARAADSWTQLASMHVGRQVPAAVVLADGRVLVVAGLGSSQGGTVTFAQRHLASAEIYDAATDIWTNVVPLNVARQMPNAILLADGRVLVAGGAIPIPDPNPINASTDDVEIYDPAANTWTTAALATIVTSARAVRLRDGRVLFAGGQGFAADPLPLQSVQSAAQLYDPATNTWTPAASMNSPRDEFGMALLRDGRVLAISGAHAGGSSAETYDPATNVWTMVAPVPVGLGGRVSATTLLDGRVVAVGNTVAAIYNPPLNTWTAIGAPLSLPTTYFDVEPLTDGGALLLNAAFSATDGVTSSAQRMDPVFLALTPTDPMPAQVQGRAQNAGVVLHDGAILLAGGFARAPGAGPSFPSDAVQRYGANQVGPIAQTITVTQGAPATAAFNTTFSLSATAPGGPVAIAVSGVCSFSAGVVTMTSATGTCTTTFNQAGSADYLAAPEVTQTTTAEKASQTITVTQGAPATAQFKETFQLQATAPGGAVVIDASGACSLKGDALRMMKPTKKRLTCTVTFDQAGNANYFAAPQVVQTTTVH